MKYLVFVPFFALGLLARRKESLIGLEISLLLALAFIFAVTFILVLFGIGSHYTGSVSRFLSPEKFIPVAYSCFGLGSGIFFRELFGNSLYIAVVSCLPIMALGAGVRFGIFLSLWICKNLSANGMNRGHK
jgi:hypothetical protein